MKRERPKVTNAQSQSIAEYSRLEAEFEARVRDELGPDLEQHFHAAGAEYRRHLASLESAEYWFPRIAVVPVAVLAIAFVLATLYGLWSGEFPKFGRYVEGWVLRSVNPAAYWLSFAHHIAMGGLFSWLAIRLLIATRWLHRIRDFVQK